MWINSEINWQNANEILRQVSIIIQNTEHQRLFCMWTSWANDLQWIFVIGHHVLRERCREVGMDAEEADQEEMSMKKSWEWLWVSWTPRSGRGEDLGKSCESPSSIWRLSIWKKLLRLYLGGPPGMEFGDGKIYREDWALIIKAFLSFPSWNGNRITPAL